MKLQKKNAKKIHYTKGPQRSSVIPLLILLFLLVFLIAKVTNTSSIQKVESNTGSISHFPSPSPQVRNITPSTNSLANHHPVFATLQLPQAQVGVPYSTVLTGEDADVNDNLTMTVLNLPNGIGYTCSWGPRNNKKMIDCVISGVTNFSYSADVFAMVKDDKGNSVTNKYTFQVIQPTPTAIPPTKIPSATPTFVPYVYPTWTPTP